MSTVRKLPVRTRREAEEDPFRYGWRYVRRGGSNGREKIEQVPLTQEDILHPQEEDFRVHSPAHNEDCAYLKAVFAARLVDRPGGAVVFSDCRIAWDVADVEPHGPDVMVIFGAQPRRRWPATFRVDREGVRPRLIVEITSPETRQTDLVAKRHEYYQAKVPCYVIVDEQPGREGEERKLQLIGYKRGRKGYVRMRPDKRGWLWLEAVGLWIGVADERAVCYDEQGRRIGDYREVVKARQEADARIRELEAEVRRLRGES